MSQAPSDGEDCGLDGDPKDPVLVGSMNRLIRRMKHAHIEPLHAAAKEHSEWIEEAKDMLAEIRGGIKVVKFLAAGLIAAFAGGFIFAIQLWQKISTIAGH